MIEADQNTKKQMYKSINTFKQNFYMTYGVQLNVSIDTDTPLERVPLIVLVEVGNIILKNNNIINEITDKIRKREFVHTRQCIMKIARDLDYTCNQIGRFFNCDHSTVIHSNKLINNFIEFKDFLTLTKLTEIQHEINKKCGVTDTVQPDDGEELITE